MILSLLNECAAKKAHTLSITDVRIGLCYTAVRLEDGSAGVAYTFREHIAYGCDVFQGKRPISGKRASGVLEYLKSDDILERSVGVATANALINQQQEGLLEGDIIEQLSLCAEDRVGMVGYFHPLMPALKPKVKDLLVFDAIENAPDVFSDQSARDLLPSCNVAIITATTLINKTLEPLLDACKNCRQIVLLGATTPLAPDVFKPFGITLLSGITIADAEAILCCVSEGGGMGSFRGYIKKVNLPIPSDK